MDDVHACAVKVLNSKGEEVSQGQMGNLAVKFVCLSSVSVLLYFINHVLIRLPLPPGAMSTIWKNDEKFVKTYFTKFPVNTELGVVYVVWLFVCVGLL